MKDVNKVFLIGRLTKSISEENKNYTMVGQTPKASISLAVNRSVKKGDTYSDEANFFDIALWGKRAETLKPYLGKGTQIAVVGELHQERWEKDGKTNSRIVVNADDIQLIGGKGKQGDSSGSKESSGGSSNPQGEMDFPEDVPF